MRKLLTLWIALAAIVGISESSLGGSMMLLGVGAAPAGGGGAAPTSTPGAVVAVQVHAFGSGTVTFSNLNGGVNFPSGATVYVGVGLDQSPTTLTSPQIRRQCCDPCYGIAG
jgi:hypothetical protein